MTTTVSTRPKSLTQQMMPSTGEIARGPRRLHYTPADTDLASNDAMVGNEGHGR